MNSSRMQAFFLIVIFLTVVIVTPLIHQGKSGRLTLLTVLTDGNETAGGTADLYLDIRPGEGNVYLATFPFAKLDTQISTRFAKEVACAYTQARCEDYDFFYTIHADSTIIGGPSAGAAIASLTAALLENEGFDEGITITGTISAGGIVGPVGSVEEKVLAAEEAGLHTVLVPRWSLDTNATNRSSGQEGLDITVKEVGSLQEVLAAITGEPLPAPPVVKAPEEYHELMAAIADRLCERSEQIASQVTTGFNTTAYNESRRFLESAAAAQGLDYSRASYCYSANLRLRELQLRDFSNERLSSLAGEVGESIANAKEGLEEQSLRTFSDLQTKAIVDERLREAEGYLQEDNLTPQLVAYATERYHSAVIWGSFFGLAGEHLQLDEEHLAAACQEKLSEVEERKGYVSLLFGDVLAEQESLDDAYVMYASDEYALCLFKASKAKAELEVILSSFTVADDEYASFVEQKLSLAGSLIMRESSVGRFPLMGYSYYEYAGSLLEEDPYLSSMFSSYALELSDLSMYFPPERSSLASISEFLAQPFILGFLAGIVSLLLVVAIVPQGSQKKRARRKD